MRAYYTEKGSPFGPHFYHLREILDPGERLRSGYVNNFKCLIYILDLYVFSEDGTAYCSSAGLKKSPEMMEDLRRINLENLLTLTQP